MMFVMTKETRLNLRITDEFRKDIETLAAYHGLTMSSYAHSLLVRAIRREKESEPEAFATRGVKAAEVILAPVVATITPAVDPKDEIRRTINADEVAVAKDRTTPRKRKTG